MTLADIKSRQNVLDAIAEFDRLGRESFLEKYGFHGSRSHWLVHDNKRYDSKAIVGAAHGYARPDLGPLPAADFSGGAATVRPKLEDLGFRIEVMGSSEVTAAGVRTSSRLTAGAVYTRADLKTLFTVTDATINTGVFRPKGTSSIWLFITEEKTADRTPYRDHLDGDTLHCQGQTSGRTDAQIINHAEDGFEILVFFRTRKYEHPGAGFRYLGPFQYVSHRGAYPTSFVLRCSASVFSGLPPSVADEAPFDPSNITDARERISRTIAQRRGQKAFRDNLLAAYCGRCAISGCAVLDVLEAAHIHPYRGLETNKTGNGLLLRSDLHTLFDCLLLTVDPEALTVIVAPQLRGSDYESLQGRPLRSTDHPSQAPSKEALAWHRTASGL